MVSTVVIILIVVYILAVIGCRKEFMKRFIENPLEDDEGGIYLFFTFFPFVNIICYFVLTEASWNKLAKWIFTPKEKKKKK